jgi:hypothetical protein
MTGRAERSQRNRAVAPAAPKSWAAIKLGTSAGRMPLNVSVAALARVTAGLAKEVDAVNQYAAVMYVPTAKGTADERSREQPHITDSNPKVAINSLKTCEMPLRACRDEDKSGSANIRWAQMTPTCAPKI